MSSARYTSVELLKGLGIIYLIGLHEWVWMWLDLTRFEMRWAEMTSAFPYFGYFGLHVLGFQVPLLAGVTFYIATTRKQTALGIVLKRIVMLMSLGYLVNYLCWGIYGVLDWDVLQFIGLSMLLTFPLVRWLKGFGVMLSLVIGTLALIFSNQYPWSQWQDNYLYAIFIGSPEGVHFWPLCPWLFVWTAGLAIGYVLESKREILRNSLLPIGIGMVLISIIAGDYHPVVTMALWGGDMFKASPLYITGIVGSSSLLIWCLERWFKTNTVWRERIERSFVVKMGRSILWIFLLNTIVGYHATHWVLNNFEMSFMQALMAYLGLVVGTLLIGYVIAVFVDRGKEIAYA